MPCSGPRTRPERRSASRARAMRSASGLTSMIDRSEGPRRSRASMRSRYCRVRRSALSSPEAIIAPSSAMVISSSRACGPQRRGGRRGRRQGGPPRHGQAGGGGHRAASQEGPGRDRSGAGPSGGGWLVMARPLVGGRESPPRTQMSCTRPRNSSGSKLSPASVSRIGCLLTIGPLSVSMGGCVSAGQRGWLTPTRWCRGAWR